MNGRNEKKSSPNFYNSRKGLLLFSRDVSSQTYLTTLYIRIPSAILVQTLSLRLCLYTFLVKIDSHFRQTLAKHNSSTSETFINTKVKHFCILGPAYFAWFESFHPVVTWAFSSNLQNCRVFSIRI